MWIAIIPLYNKNPPLKIWFFSPKLPLFLKKLHRTKCDEIGDTPMMKCPFLVSQHNTTAQSGVTLLSCVCVVEIVMFPKENARISAHLDINVFKPFYYIVSAIKTHPVEYNTVLSSSGRSAFACYAITVLSELHAPSAKGCL